MTYTTNSNSNYSVIGDDDCLIQDTNSRDVALTNTRQYSTFHPGYYTIVDNDEGGEAVAVFRYGVQIV